MKVLVTGSEGMIGAVVMQVLQDDGNKVFGFDIVNGQDILKPDQLQNAI